MENQKIRGHFFRGHFVSAAVKVSLERLLSPGAMDRQMGFSLLPVNHRFVNIQMWFFFLFSYKRWAIDRRFIPSYNKETAFPGFFDHPACKTIAFPRGSA
ncbi:hypothetical protein LQE96_01290 [Phocea massiliensis]|uniref:hypothetical protein n=1 Tax=Merdimmobilis hominis TaxID=2897707 RepID=UPI001E36138B|nr:hypothetical protein [Merdimmobilis hominis]MCD4835473.1 hypothetical protein [Merdimmobilis hominis]